ncbi:MAG TPA: response regulator [Bryobacteraceae bacterium]|jgi:two-component system cell cycle sensor histidine kinase/response regulator CckA|nr:response regulator [Bryobacteraceae bacterium]
MNLEGIRALLVEDNPGDARLFFELVRETGAGYLKLEHVDRLDKALERLSSEHFDVVLLDLSLPDEQGLTTLLRTHAHAPKVPIVILTGLDDEAMAVRAVRAGAQDYLVKGRVDGDLLVRSMRYATERWRAVEALERREEHYRSLIEHSLDLISILNIDGTIRYVSPSHERVLGYPSDDLVGQNVFGFIHADDIAGVKDAFAAQDGSASLECRFRHKDGTWRMLESFGRNLSHVPGVSGLVVNSRDVTDRKRLEEQLHHSQRLEAVGRLAGGVAHDFNNLLMVITGYSQMLLDGMAPGDTARDDLEQVVKASERATDLTRQLLAFSRRQVVRPAILNLNLLVRDMDRMLRRVIGEDIELVASLAPDLKTVRADPGQIEQVVLNIAVNARDAMPNGGKLTLETANLQVTDEFARMRPTPKPGHYAMLSMGDTGFGMDAAVLLRLFEPFFTTKENGTGLGLSTSYGIIKQSGGDIWVDSKPGQGTTFRIYLPVAEEATEPVETPRESAVPRGAETILLVEDEDGVRRVVETMLTRHGYNVLSSGSCGDAMALAERYAGPIHLLITDVVMPGMSGRTMAESLIAQRPETKVLYVSGYGGPIEPETTTGFLQKPFTTEELARKIRELFPQTP